MNPLTEKAVFTWLGPVWRHWIMTCVIMNNCDWCSGIAWTRGRVGWEWCTETKSCSSLVRRWNDSRHTTIRWKTDNWVNRWWHTGQTSPRQGQLKSHCV